MVKFHPLEEIAEQLEKVFFALENFDFPHEPFPNVRDPQSLITHTWHPGITLEETADSFVIRAELAAVDPDEAEVFIKDGLLVLRDLHEPNPTSDYNMMEMDTVMNKADTTLHELENFGAFATEIALPSNIDVNTTVADFVEDMLEIDMPKLEVTKHRRMAAETQA